MPPRKLAALALLVAGVIVVSSVAYLALIAPGSSGGTRAVVSSLASPPQTSPYITEYQVGGTNSQPNGIASDSKGDIWFTLATDYAIGELDPANGTTHEYRIPGQTGDLVSSGIAVDSARGVVWVADQLGNSIWKFDIAKESFTRYPLPSALSSPYQVAVDAKGDAWFTEIDGGRLGEVTPQGSLTQFSIPGGSSTTLVGPAGIAIKDGVVWFTEVYTDRVGSFENGTYSFYPIPGGTSPTGIAVDSQGDLWVTLHGGDDIAEVDPADNSSRVISTSLPAGSEQTLPYFIAVDPLGNVWFNEHYGNAIARFSPSNQSLVEYEIPSRVASLGNISGALTIGLGPSGRPWFTEDYTGKIGTVAPEPLGLEISVSSEGPDRFSISVSGASPSTLAFEAPGALQASFSQDSGSGSYTSTMTVSPSSGGSPLALTISAVSPEVVSSQVVEFQP